MLRLTIAAGILAALAVVRMAAGVTAEVSRIPLCAGLTIVSAISEPKGDYEAIVRIGAVTPQAVTLTYSAQVPTPAGNIRHEKAQRTVLQRDLKSASLYMRWYSASAPVTIPGSTGFGASAEVLRALKTKGTATLALVDRTSSVLTADRNIHPNIYDNQTAYTVRRVATVRLPVIVNDQRGELPAIHARGEHLGDRVEFFFLDDEDNPLALASRTASGPASANAAETRVVRISFRCQAATPGVTQGTPSRRLEEALLERGRADVYDIHFGFNSAEIRPESEPTLREIAALLNRYPDWTLDIEGHTDSIASDAFNLDLSQRRAAAVKTALTSQYGVSAARLSTSGHGESRPRETNDTLEGRARNRRVELVRR